MMKRKTVKMNGYKAVQTRKYCITIYKGFKEVARCLVWADATKYMMNEGWC